MKLPGGYNAIVDIAKLRDYCLDPHHPRGRHKARAFAATLGLAPADAEFLRSALLRAAREAEAVAGDRPQPMDCASGRDYTKADDLFCTIGLRDAVRELELLSVVAVLEDIKDHKLLRGQVGTVVVRLAPGVYEVEFSDDEGRTYASLSLRADQLLQLHREPSHQAA